MSSNKVSAGNLMRDSFTEKSTFRLNTGRKRQVSEATRVRQIALDSKNSINYLVNPLNNTNISEAKSYHSYLTDQNGAPYLNEHLLLKKPFKQINSSLMDKDSKESDEINSSTQIAVDGKFSSLNNGRMISYNQKNPATNLILKTAQSINEFVDLFERNQATIKCVKPKNTGYRYSKTPGLRPLNFVLPNGPKIKNCIGIIKEPSDNTAVQLKEIYEYKLKLLEKKKKSTDNGFNLFKNESSNELINSDELRNKSRSVSTPEIFS